MNANLQDAELLVAMSDPNVDLTAGVEPQVEQAGRNSPASAVCYLDRYQAQERTTQDVEPSSTAMSEPGPSERSDEEVAGPATRGEDDTDSTPRSEVPTALDAVPTSSNLPRDLNSEPGYFSPQPLRVYASSKFSTSTPTSTDTSPGSIASPLATSAHTRARLPTERIHRPHIHTLSETLGRPSVQRDHSSASTASVATIRAHSVEPLQTTTPPSKPQRDGPFYPNQSYAALQHQHYPPPYSPHILRTRSSHPSHYSSFSTNHINTSVFSSDLVLDTMESGSRTVGNSPASSPGLFSPTTPPLRQNHTDEQGYYSSPYLHHTHRQAPKETHVADVDVDPISGRKIINQYEVIDELGRGVHGKVKLGRDLDIGGFVAIKIVDRYSKRRRLGKNTSHEDKIKKEIAILKKARHPNIVSLLEVIDDPSRKKVYIILEHVELGEVKWRTKGAREITLIEWRRYQRESEGIFDNESAAMEDERILNLAHRKLQRQQRRKARAAYQRRQSGANANTNEPWSFEFGGDSEDETPLSWKGSQSSTRDQGRPPVERKEDSPPHEANMETAYRSTTPTAPTRQENPSTPTGLEGTMYGAYETELLRGRTPSIAGSSSSHITDEEEEVPEHFRYVPLMTISAARDTFRDTVLGLEYLHYQGVIHRDIKPANLLQTKEHRIKISDFGVSYLGRQPSADSTGDQSESDFQDADEAIELAKTVGTPAFYAPELCRTDLDDDTPPVTGKIDIWALGVTLYCLIFGRVPFHHNNTFALMKVITDTEAYIPRFRLKPVAEQDSRPNSHGRMYHNMTSSKRAPHDLEFEEVDENLRDLLTKLLIKDPRKRISIKEIKRHPWLLQGIDNSISWVEETDPGRSSQGKRIEVSKDDLDMAVVPITLIERVRSGVRKTMDALNRSFTRGGSRKRAQSHVTSHDQSQPASTHSSSSAIYQEGRRPSLALNQSIFEALSRSREPEHPLSQSVTASPESKEEPKYFESPDSRTASPAFSVESNEHLPPLAGPSRQHPPERAYSTMSSAASVRTIRQSDLTRTGHIASPNLPPALPGTPTTLETPGGSNLGGIFGGVPRRIVNSMRSRERMLKPSHEPTRAKSIDRLAGADDPHGGPSIALSNTLAAGHVDQPDLLKERSPGIGRSQSPNPFDLNSQRPPERAPSRQSSTSSASSHLNTAYAPQRQLEVGPTSTYDVNRAALSPLYRDTSEDRFNRAKDELVRQRVKEHESRGRPKLGTSRRPTSALSQTECPPSPDDESFFQRQKIEEYLNQQHHRYYPSLNTGAAIYHANEHYAQPRALTSSSSEDHFTSMSQSTSNPSIPSVVSADSSVTAEDCIQRNSLQRITTAPSGESINQFDMPVDDPAGYDGDHPIESEEDDDSDEDDFLVMGKKKSNPQQISRSESISNAELARSSIRREIISSRRRSARSGSNGTVKKIRSHGESDNEEHKEPVS
ncbi:kinase-like protein [Lojkania enalia]|uniref:non-specific serine/threonine protein kinase n=1 Tax=Lojkania enalia TaxID=147567 RepID=A0A9P4KFA9_9PLEO|nr:kinase-like protein [Didymosphaeria enalia]